MQQVGTDAILATAQVVDPRRLPALISGRRAMATLRHAWILNRPMVLRGAGALVLLAGAALAWEMRDHIDTGLRATATLLEARVAEAGFAIKTISISGQALTSEADIFAALGVDPRISTLNFDAEHAREQLRKLPSVESATIRKLYPGRVEVVVVEKVPVARWRVDGVTFLVDANGDQIAVDAGDNQALPLVVGDGAADDALVMIKAMDHYDALKSGLAALSRIADRRWDLIYYSGLRVQLPETGVGQALSQLDAYQARYALLDRDVTQIDLRVPGTVAIRPGEAAAKVLVDLAKARMKPGARHVVDTSYETPAEVHGD